MKIIFGCNLDEQFVAVFFSFFMLVVDINTSEGTYAACNLGRVIFSFRINGFCALELKLLLQLLCSRKWNGRL